MFAIAISTLGACAELKSAGNQIGAATKEVTTEIGHASRDATRAIGHASRDAVNAVKDELNNNTL